MIRASFIRALRLVPVMITVTFAAFLLLDLSPSDPAVIRAGLNATPEAVAEIREELGLNGSVIERYWNWLSGLAHGDMGESVARRDVTVSELIGAALPRTFELIVLSQVLAIAMSVPAAIASARRPGGAVDRVISSSSFALLATPPFVLGIYLSYVFGVRLGWLPTIATRVPSFTSDPIEHLRNYILPTVTLSLGIVAIYIRILRADLIETLKEDYVMLAQARGLSDTRIMWRHALRPSSLNTVTAAGLAIGDLIGGALIVEILFAFPGMGQLLVESVLRSDYFVVAGVVALFSVAYVSINFAVDILYSILDPRIRDVAR